MNRQRLFASSMKLAVLSTALLVPTAAAAESAVVAGSATVSYQVPAEAPTGEVHVMSLGVADLPVRSLIGTERFAHVRLAATNRQDDVEWILDAREQILELSDGSRSAPRFAETSTGGGPARITLRRGERGYLDLFYPAGDSNPDWTSLSWVVRRAGAVIVATSIFERLPAYGGQYAHYRPAEYSGGTLHFGDLWCHPWYGRGYWQRDTWLGPYSGYRRYRYGRRPHGFVVSDGHTRWDYHRGRPSSGGAASGETVGSRWRQRSPQPSAAMAVAPPVSGPVTAPPQPRLDDERAPWRLDVRRVRESVGDSASPLQRTREVSPSHHLERVDRTPPATSTWMRWSSSISSSSSSGSSSSSSSSSGSSSSDSSPSSPSSSSSSSPSPAPSRSDDSVGSRWRSR